MVDCTYTVGVKKKPKRISKNLTTEPASLVVTGGKDKTLVPDRFTIIIILFLSKKSFNCLQVKPQCKIMFHLITKPKMFFHFITKKIYFKKNLSTAFEKWLTSL